jgi:drug/metabolite transporter superfamily protein YnfA
MIGESSLVKMCCRFTVACDIREQESCYFPIRFSMKLMLIEFAGIPTAFKVVRFGFTYGTYGSTAAAAVYS